MADALAKDGTRLFWAEAGHGTPVVFVHEFGGNHWSWEPQMSFFARRHRCVTFAARGFPPSDIPVDIAAYSQAQATDNIIAVMEAAGIERAHLVSLFMGGFAVLHAGLRYPGRVLSLTAAGAGCGAEKAHKDYFRSVSEQVATNFESRGAAAFAPIYAEGASRVQFQAKDPQNGRGSRTDWPGIPHKVPANTMRGVQMHRPSLYDLEAEFRAMTAPLLVMVGDEDDHCLQPGLFLKRTVPASGLAVLPKTGHTLNLEEPTLFDQLLAEFIAQVEAGRWFPRDARANRAQIMRTD